MKNTLEFLKILFKIFIIIEIVIVIFSVISGAFYISFGLEVFAVIMVIFININNIIFEKLSQIIILVYNSFLFSPLVYFQIFIIMFFAILFFILKKKINNMLAFSCSIIPMIIILSTLSSYYLRTIPDYSSKTNERIVTLSDYKKYQQGYCLKEDRILPKDELYKRVVIDVFTKQLIHKDIVDKRVYNRIANYKYKIHKDISLDNYKDYLRKNAYSKGYVNYDELELVDYTKYLVVKNNTAGFTKPIILVSDSSISITFYTDIAFEFKDNIYRTYSFYLLDEFDEREDKEKEYKYRLRVFNHEFLSYEADIKKKRSYRRKFDNCGYSNLNPEKQAKESLEEINFK
ncbi:hypothetical protein AVANS_1201 [Campylobacter sp. RM5004]|uniref:hypothetical protein n=1 Tax=Campylobacter sp. RM5004 TaxID=1660078 RepID=UPI001EFB1709|nr:hypothetical protein [Campylobacter sp. RM5004]ULO01820.1 hypothetical protein AVANS_1201 [Campylobacter sp. RM5004]